MAKQVVVEHPAFPDQRYVVDAADAKEWEAQGWLKHSDPENLKAEFSKKEREAAAQRVQRAFPYDPPPILPPTVHGPGAGVSTGAEGTGAASGSAGAAAGVGTGSSTAGAVS